ncbi:hypothetical protein AAKU67_002229 [Oxalobacteraceae bacterium GrIS 2.11]
MQTRTQWIIFIALVAAIHLWFGYIDWQDQIAEENHTKAVIDLARKQGRDEERQVQFQKMYDMQDEQLNLKGIPHHDQ